MLPGTLFQYAPSAFQCYNSYPMPDALQQRTNYNSSGSTSAAAAAAASPLYQSLFAAASQAPPLAQLQPPQYAPTATGPAFGTLSSNNNGYESQLKLGAYGYAPRGLPFQSAPATQFAATSAAAAAAQPQPAHQSQAASATAQAHECGAAPAAAAAAAPAMDVKMAINMNMNMNMDLKGHASAYGGGQFAGGYCAPGLGVNLMGGGLPSLNVSVPVPLPNCMGMGLGAVPAGVQPAFNACASLNSVYEELFKPNKTHRVKGALAGRSSRLSTALHSTPFPPPKPLWAGAGAICSFTYSMPKPTQLWP